MATRPKDETDETKPKTDNPGTDQGGETGNTTKIPTYLEAALRIPSSYPLGAPGTDTHLFTDNSDTASGKNMGAAPTPGIFVAHFVPTYGVSTDSESALNRAAYHDFNVIRSEISGNRPYMPADHMIYRICNSSLRDLYDMAIRIYGLLSNFSATNIYRPRHILTAMGLDYENWNAHASDLFQWLQVHQSALVPFPTVPIGTIDTRRHVFNSCLFTDGEPESSQTYVMVQRVYYSYEVVDEVKGVTVRDMPTTYDQFIDLWDTMYNAFQNSSDVYVIAADIRRAFKDKVVTNLPSITSDYKVPYSKFDTMLDTIMNAGCVQTDVFDTFKIYEDINTGAVKCEPTFTFEVQTNGTTSAPVVYPSPMLNHINSVKADPDSQTILNAVRMKPVVRTSRPQYNFAAEKVTWTTLVDSMGTELIVRFIVGGFDLNGAFKYEFVPPMAVVDIDDANATIALTNMIRLCGLISNFDWHPPVQFTSYRSSTRQWTQAYRVEDIQNYIPISDDQIKMIHDAYLLSQFGF